MVDKTKGHQKGDYCPSCKKGLVIIRTTTDEKGKPYQNYACCNSCSWRTLD